MSGFNSAIKLNGKFQYSFDLKNAGENFHKACVKESREKFQAQQQKERDEKEAEEERRRTPVVREGKKVGRNDPCPCGSGKKFKKCCDNGN